MISFIFDKCPFPSQVRHITEVNGDTLSRRIQPLSRIKQLIQPDGAHQSFNGSHPEGGALTNVRLINAPICIEVPHVCRFFSGAGQKRRRRDLHEGRTAALVQELCFSIVRLLHFQKVRLVERPHGSRVPPVVSSAWWQWASLESPL